MGNKIARFNMMNPIDKPSNIPVIFGASANGFAATATENPDRMVDHQHTSVFNVHIPITKNETLEAVDVSASSFFSESERKSSKSKKHSKSNISISSCSSKKKLSPQAKDSSNRIIQIDEVENNSF